MSRFGAIVLLAGVVAAPRGAGALTGVELSQLCASANLDLCISYLRGLVDGLALAGAPTPTGQGYCPPPGLSLPQALSVVQVAFQQHPEQLVQEAGLVAGRALITAYPCRIE